MPFANSPPSFVRQSPGHLYFKSFEDSVVRIFVPRGKGVDEIPFLYFEKEANIFPHQITLKNVSLDGLLVFDSHIRNKTHNAVTNV